MKQMYQGTNLFLCQKDQQLKLYKFLGDWYEREEKTPTYDISWFENLW